MISKSFLNLYFFPVLVYERSVYCFWLLKQTKLIKLLAFSLKRIIWAYF